jgi:hypothetical protein
MACRRSPTAGGALWGACYLGAGYLVFRLMPAPVTLSRELADPHRSVAQYGPDAVVASLTAGLLWLCAVWVTLALTAMYLSLLPGVAGRCGDAVLRRVLPAALRRLVVASTGATVLLSPLPAVASAGQPPVVPTSTAAASAVPAPGWPTDRPPSTSAPDWPTDRPPTVPAPDWPIEQAPAVPVAGAGGPARNVTVTAGDSLWTIAATALGPAATEHRIAVAWPYWYRANRSVIGGDPGLIRPGTELVTPPALAGAPAARQVH